MWIIRKCQVKIARFLHLYYTNKIYQCHASGNEPAA
jgi:hypothetical protein